MSLNRRVVLHAIDATPARWRGDAGSSPLDRARTTACAPVALVDFHTGAERDMGRAGPFRATHRPVQRRGQMLSRQMLRTPRSGPQIARGTGRFPGWHRAILCLHPRLLSWQMSLPPECYASALQLKLITRVLYTTIQSRSVRKKAENCDYLASCKTLASQGCQLSHSSVQRKMRRIAAILLLQGVSAFVAPPSAPRRFSFALQQLLSPLQKMCLNCWTSNARPSTH